MKCTLSSQMFIPLPLLFFLFPPPQFFPGLICVMVTSSSFSQSPSPPPPPQIGYVFTFIVFELLFAEKSLFSAAFSLRSLSLYFSIFFCFKTVNALFNCRILMGKSLSALHSNSSLFIPKEFYSSEWRDLSKRKVNALSPSLFNITVSLETQMENDRSVELKVSLAGFHIFGLIEVHSMN